MKVFVTGATGFVGSAVVRELIAHGHQVVGLVRSADGAARLEQAGAAAITGDLEAPESLRAGAERCDAVIHTGFVHDFSRFAAACMIDRVAIETLGAVTGAAGKPLLITAGVAFLNAAGPITVETDRAHPPSDIYPRASEAAATRLAEAGTAVGTVRLPPSVHGAGDHGFVPMLIDIARRTGRSAYIGAGGNVWPAVHVDDAATVFRRAIERGPVTETYHAVAETGVPFREIAEAIANGLGLPCVSIPQEEAAAHFGWFHGFATIDQPTSSAQTRAQLAWTPSGPGLIEDIRSAGYFNVSGE